jgi:hypothetical protein
VAEATTAEPSVEAGEFGPEPAEQKGSIGRSEENKEKSHATKPEWVTEACEIPVEHPASQAPAVEPPPSTRGKALLDLASSLTLIGKSPIPGVEYWAVFGLSNKEVLVQQALAAQKKIDEIVDAASTSP